MAAETHVLCTSNLKDFPDDVMHKLGIQVVDPDTLLHSLAVTHPDEMKRAHHHAVAAMKGSTDASTLEALIRANAPRAADQMAHVMSLVLVRAHVRDGHIVHAYLRGR